MHEMNYETEEHEQRLLENVTKIGRKLDFMPQEIEETEASRILARYRETGSIQGYPHETPNIDARGMGRDQEAQ